MKTRSPTFPYTDFNCFQISEREEKANTPAAFSARPVFVKIPVEYFN